MSVQALTELQAKVSLLFWEEVGRGPTSTELTTYTTSPNEVFTDISEAEFRKLLSEGTIVYTHSDWTIDVFDIFGGDYHGVTLTNGKIGLVSSKEYNSMDNSLITTNFDFNHLGDYTANTVETYNYGKYQLFDLFSSDETVSNLTVNNFTQELNMQYGTLINQYSLSNLTESVEVHQTVYALRQSPYSALQVFTMCNQGASTLNLLFYHQFNTPTNIKETYYNSDTIFVQDLDGNEQNLNFFSAEGILKKQNKLMNSTSAYRFGSGLTYNHLGYNIDKLDIDIAYNKFQLTIPASDEFTFSIYTSTSSEFDFGAPGPENKRILLNLLNKTESSIITENNNKWADLWTSDIEITPKSGITSDESNAINEANKFLRFSLFNIYSSVRSDINIESVPLNLATFDPTGQIYWNAEMWLLPVLTIFKPRLARSLLEFRYSQIETAQKIATAHGYDGTKYRFNNDLLPLSETFWDGISPLHIFSTAFVSIATWFYYLVTLDMNWLENRGYAILRNNANFLYSAGTVSGSTFSINSVLGYNNIKGDDNTLTNYFARLAFQFAIEASYEINVPKRTEWQTAYDGIVIEVASTFGSFNNIVKLDSDAVAGTDYKILEALMVLHPFYSRYFFDLSASYTLTTEQDNLSYYESNTQSSYIDNSVNRLLRASIYADIAQQLTVYADRLNYINQFNTNWTFASESNISPPWGIFTNPAFLSDTHNDINTSALYLLTILAGIARIRIKGGVSEGRFYYEEPGVFSDSSGVMPTTWQSLTINGVEDIESKCFEITNVMFYP